MTEQHGPVGAVPENANAHCPGTESEQAGQAPSCEGCPNQAACASAPKGPDPELADIAERLRPVKHIILVLSGKGGVGEVYSLHPTTSPADLPGIGETLPTDAVASFGINQKSAHQPWCNRVLPGHGEAHSACVVFDLGAISVCCQGQQGWLLALCIELQAHFYCPVSAIRACGWGCHRDHPSGGRHHRCPQEINFCKKVGLPVLGVVENMSGLQQPLSGLKFLIGDEDHTSTVLDTLKAVFQDNLEAMTANLEVFRPTAGGAEAMAQEMGVEFLGRIPLDPALALAGESGSSLFGETLSSGPAAPALKAVVDTLLQKVERQSQTEQSQGADLPAGDR
eukprot:jgi/Botrbrau1/11031/Bobra.92_2s0004.1